MINPFFKNTGPYEIDYLLKSLDLKSQKFSNDNIKDIKDLKLSENGDITFFHSKKYNDLAKSTKASYCITNNNLKSFLPESCKVIISENILLHTAMITKIFYPDSVVDDFDSTVIEINNTEFKDKIKFVVAEYDKKILFDHHTGGESPIEQHQRNFLIKLEKFLLL